MTGRVVRRTTRRESKHLGGNGCTIKTRSKLPLPLPSVSLRRESALAEGGMPDSSLSSRWFLAWCWETWLPSLVAWGGRQGGQAQQVCTGGFLLYFLMSTFQPEFFWGGGKKTHTLFPPYDTMFQPRVFGCPRGSTFYHVFLEAAKLFENYQDCFPNVFCEKSEWH